jgi:hypothetical protein
VVVNRKQRQVCADEVEDEGGHDRSDYAALAADNNAAEYDGVT